MVKISKELFQFYVMIRHCVILLFFASQIFCTWLLIPSAWSTEHFLSKGQHDAVPSLSLLVSKYLTADSQGQGKIKDQIFSHPQANLKAVTTIIKNGAEYGKEPVGIQVDQEIRVQGRNYHYGLYVPSSYDPARAYSLIMCLHGAGFTGDSYLQRWETRLTDQYILACPTISMGAWWSRSAEELVLATIKTIRARVSYRP